jgi:hypothetical protein
MDSRDTSTSRTADAEHSVLRVGLTVDDNAGEDNAGSCAGGAADVPTGLLDLGAFAFALGTMMSPATRPEGLAADDVVTGTVFEVAAVLVRGRFRSLKNENCAVEC